MPKTVAVSAKAPKIDKEASVNLNCFGETLDEDRKLVTDEVIKSNYEANAVITIQGGIRRMLTAGKTQEEIQAAYDNYKPGTAMARVSDPIGAAVARFASMSAEEQKDFMQKLRASAAGAKKE